MVGQRQREGVLCCRKSVPLGGSAREEKGEKAPVGPHDCHRFQLQKTGLFILVFEIIFMNGNLLDIYTDFQFINDKTINFNSTINNDTIANIVYLS